jgi:hypothetical protein
MPYGGLPIALMVQGSDMLIFTAQMLVKSKTLT